MKYRINYTKILTQVNALRKQEDYLRNEIRRLEEMENECRSFWQGETSNAFVKKLDLLSDSMYRTSKQLSELVETIWYCTEKIQQEDEKAMLLAERLEKGHL